MPLFPRRRPADATEDDPVDVVAAPPIVYGYECPCGERLESLVERDLTERAWAHARRCRHQSHAEARAADARYGHPDHFVYEER